MWQDKYIGIPFKANGRNESGLDCWGLARLIYEKEYNIQLPSFSSEYVIEDKDRIDELISQYREGWEVLETPMPGCMVLFKIFGELTHVGVMVTEETFIHVRRGSNTVIDSIKSIRWKNRTIGFFKYNQNTGVLLNAIPHPLNTKRFTLVLEEGTNLEQVYERINSENAIGPELSKTVTIMVNGIPIPRILWPVTVLNCSDTVEYRAVPGREAIKLIALIAIAYFAPYLAVEMLGTTALTASATAAGITASTATMASLSFAGTLAAVGVTVAGSYLINAISPVRQPSSEDPGNPAQQDLLSGGTNAYNPYGAIPVVLGKIRYNPPMGAKAFASFPSERESFLNMLLVWGYGPLTITDYRIGEVSWNEYQFNSLMPGNGRITLDRKTGVNESLEADFNKIYGSDVDQQFINLELFGPELGLSGEGGVVGSTLINGSQLNFDQYTGIPIVPIPEEVAPELVPFTGPYDETGEVLNPGWHIDEDTGEPYYTGTLTTDQLEGSGNDGGDGDTVITGVAVPGEDINDSGSNDNNVDSTTAITGTGCPDPLTPILISYTETIAAGKLNVGDYIFTPHEITGSWGIFPITVKEIIEQPKVKITFISGKTTIVSESHRYLMTDGTWNTVNNLTTGSEIKGAKFNETISSIESIGTGQVVKFEIQDAHTYVASGLISHNQKIDGDNSADESYNPGTSNNDGSYFGGGGDDDEFIVVSGE